MSTLCLVHDALGRLVTVGPSTAAARVAAGQIGCMKEGDLASVSTRFEYDAMNRRVARGDFSPTTRWTEYTPGPGELVYAEQTRPATTGGAWSRQREYVWLDHRLIAQVEPSG